MAQVINDPGRAALFGQSLGGSIGSGLAGLAQGKMQGMLDQQKKQSLMDQLTKGGFSPKQAQIASMVGDNPQALVKLLGMFGNPQGQQGQQNQPQEEQYETLRPRPGNQDNNIFQQSGGKQLDPLQQEKLKKLQLENAEKQKDEKLRVHTNNEIIKDIKIALDLAKKGNVVSGVEASWKKHYTPSQNRDTQHYSKALERLVGLIEGRVTDFRVKQMLKQLPNLEVDNKVKVEMLEQILDGLIGKQGILAGEYGGEKKKTIEGKNDPENVAQQAFQAATLNNNQNMAESTLNNNQETPERGILDRILGLPGLVGRNALSGILGGWGSLLGPVWEQSKKTNEQGGLYDRMPEDIKQSLMNQQILPTIDQINELLPGHTNDLSGMEKVVANIAQHIPSLLASGSPWKAALGTATGSELGSQLGGSVGGETGSAIGSVLGGMGANVLAQRPSSKTVDKYARDAFEKDKATRIKDLVKTNEQAERGLLKESSKLTQQGRKLAEQAPINKAQKELRSYEKKIKENYQSAKPLYEQASKHEKSGSFSAKNINKEASRVNDNFAKGMSVVDMAQLEKIIQDIETTTSRTATDPAGKLSIGDAKILKRNINNQIFDKNSSSVFRENAGKLVSSINDFITKNNDTKHNKPWRKAEGLYKEAAKLKTGQKEFVADQKQQIKELTREQKMAEASHKAEVKQHEQAFKVTDAEHQKAVKAIGKESYDKLLKDKASQDRLNGNLEKLTKGVNKYGSMALGSLLESIVPGGKLGGVALVGAGQMSYKEISRIRQAFKDHPALYNKTAQLLKESMRRDIPTLINKVNHLAKEIEEAD